MQSPRPILKRSAVAYPIDTSAATLASGPRHPSPRSGSASTLSVHFPPSSGLTKTFNTHSAAVYDRSPIVVSRNACALPERGCPGRTYGDAEEEQRGRTRRVKDDRRTRNTHTRIDDGCTSSSPPGVLPPLIPDQSESDDSDSSSGSDHSSFMSTAHSSPPVSIPTKSPTYDIYSNPPNLSFLPHPHHEHRERERPRGRSRTRTQSDALAEEQDHASRHRNYKVFSHDNMFGSDQGCLAGF